MTRLGHLGLKTNGLGPEVAGLLTQRLDLPLLPSRDARAVLFVPLAFVADQAFEVIPETRRRHRARFDRRF